MDAPKPVFFNDIAIRGFRGFDELRVDGLARVNLITGANNVGKTAFLEGLFALLGAHASEPIAVRVNALRGMAIISSDPTEMWGWLFYQKNMSRPISIIANADDSTFELAVRFSPHRTVTELPPEVAGALRKPTGLETTTGLVGRSALEIELKDGHGASLATAAAIANPDGSLQLSSAPSIVFPPSRILSPNSGQLGSDDTARFSRIDEAGQTPELIEILRSADDRLKGLSVYVVGPVTALRADVGIGRPVPLAYMGQGFSRLLAVTISVMTSRGGCVLVDEIENGIHHSAMPGVWRGIAEAASRASVQVFATTHSRECVLAAHQAFKERLSYDLSVYRFERANDHIRVVRHSQESLDTAADLNWELR